MLLRPLRSGSWCVVLVRGHYKPFWYPHSANVTIAAATPKTTPANGPEAPSPIYFMDMSTVRFPSNDSPVATQPLLFSHSSHLRASFPLHGGTVYQFMCLPYGLARLRWIHQLFSLRFSPIRETPASPLCDIFLSLGCRCCSILYDQGKHTTH